MKMLSAILALLALVVAEPAFAGCGSHGGGYRSRAVNTPIVVKKVVQKREVKSSVRTAATIAPDKSEVTSSVAAAETQTKPAQATAAIECSQYSAALGEMIAVPCS